MSLSFYVLPFMVNKDELYINITASGSFQQQQHKISYHNVWI